MLVTVLKENYLVVLAEDKNDERWLARVGYDVLGEEYYQEVFKDFNDMLSEVKYLIEYGAIFEDSSDEDSPFKVIEDLKAEEFLD